MHLVVAKNYIFWYNISMYSGVKRLLDIVFGVFGLILLVPLSIAVKIAYIANGDFDGIFYNQIRIGKDGKKFRMFKFRTMVKNADKKLAKLKKDPKYRDEWNRCHKITQDPRITKVGHFIRHGSIDEAPQVINMLLGQISLIGPRPLVPREIKEANGNKELYESVKPGITGWWAVNGRSNIDIKKRLELEYYYINHQGFLLDLRIFFKTIAAMFSKRNDAK